MGSGFPGSIYPQDSWTASSASGAELGMMMLQLTDKAGPDHSRALLTHHPHTLHVAIIPRIYPPWRRTGGALNE